jgi:hypothetical protein
MMQYPAFPDAPPSLGMPVRTDKGKLLGGVGGGLDICLPLLLMLSVLEKRCGAWAGNEWDCG